VNADPTRAIPISACSDADSAWPDQTDLANPIATAINSLSKYVVSSSLSEADATWRGEHPDTARLVAGDVIVAVRALKDEPGDELQIWGSGTICVPPLLRTTLLRGDPNRRSALCAWSWHRAGPHLG
jgi:hypothetical protein